ncbi:MAG: hypothetical protein NC337_03385 [Roseburia sp.]|nr:hypothetical protein [Roseburia sp.]
MHVAICDDNVADRRHLERLLSRESDKRAGTPNILYIDSYGDKDHFLRAPLKYNIVFMDMTAREGLVEEILAGLEEQGYHAPLVLYSSTVDYTAIPNLPDYVVHAKKPYLPDPLPELLRLGDRNVLANVITIQVHQNGVLQHVPKNEIMYAMPQDERYCFSLSNGTVIEIDETVSELRQAFEPYDEMKLVNKTCFANFRYVSTVTPVSVVMRDTRKLSISPLHYQKFKWLKEELLLS